MNCPVCGRPNLIDKLELCLSCASRRAISPQEAADELMRRIREERNAASAHPQKIQSALNNMFEKYSEPENPEGITVFQFRDDGLRLGRMKDGLIRPENHSFIRGYG